MRTNKASKNLLLRPSEIKINLYKLYLLNTANTRGTYLFKILWYIFVSCIRVELLIVVGASNTLFKVERFF